MGFGMFDMGFGMFDVGFGIFSVVFGIMFVTIVVVLLFVFIKGIGQWNKNNHSPRLAVDATVVAKRTSVSHHHHGHAGDIGGVHGCDTSSSTSYYVTFQVESGDRMEFAMAGSDYGMLVEGDFGKLSFQGTRYLGFERR